MCGEKRSKRETCLSATRRTRRHNQLSQPSSVRHESFPVAGCVSLVFTQQAIRTDIFRILLGDLSHLASILILLHKIQTTRSCRGKLSSPVIRNAVRELLLTYWFFFFQVYPLKHRPSTLVSSLQDILTFFSTTYLYTTLSWNCFSSAAVAIFSTSWRSNTGQPRAKYSTYSNPFWPSPVRVSDQRMTLPSTPSRLNISSLPASSFPSSSTTSSPFRKFCGHFPFGWRRWLFSPNCSCFNAREKQRRSRRIIWLHWEHIEPFTSLTGYSGIVIHPP